MIVWHIARDDAGLPLSYRSAELHLAVPATDTSDSSTLSAATPRVLNAAGLVVLDLPPTDSLNPSGDYHTLKLPGLPVSFTVPSDDPPEDVDHQVPGSDPAVYGWRLFGDDLAIETHDDPGRILVGVPDPGEVS